MKHPNSEKTACVLQFCVVNNKCLLLDWVSPALPSPANEKWKTNKDQDGIHVMWIDQKEESVELVLDLNRWTLLVELLKEDGLFSTLIK